MDNQYLSLNEYSNKYGISISTLRRRIRAGQFSYSLKFGKYFLKDQSPDTFSKKQKVTKRDNKEIRFNSGKKKFESQSSSFEQLKDEAVKDIESGKSKNDLLSALLKDSSFLVRLMDSQKELYSQIEKKEKKISEQQSQIADLDTLVALLEKENKDLKSLLYQEKEMEEWLEMK